MRIVFIGPPGSGKGTQAERLASRLGLVHLSTGEILRQAREAGSPRGLEAAKYFESGRLVPDSLVLEIVADRLAKLGLGDGCLFDGFPRTLAQARALDELLARRGTPLDRVIEFEVGHDELLRRLSARGRVDDDEATVRRRLDVYEVETRPLIDYYKQRGVLTSVDATGGIDDIARRVERSVTK
jgi:adenylate kinase